MNALALALDLGSTAIKAGLLDAHGNLQHIVSRPVPPLQIERERYESDALAYAETAEQVLAACRAHAPAVATLGMCSQRSSFLLWENATGRPVTPLISWQDSRGAGSCAVLQAHEPLLTARSGLRLTPYFFAPKLRVLLQQYPAWRARLQSGEWRAGTLDTFLIWRWTQGRHYVTDVSMAARTLLLDIHTQQWSAELCALFDIPREILPAVLPSTQMNLALSHDMTLQASLADQSAALVASVGNATDIALVNLGTGGFVIRNLPGPDQRQNGYLRTLLYQDAQAVRYASEGTLNSIAAAVAHYPLNELDANELAALDNIFCIAEPSGIGAPYFRKEIGLQFSQAVDHLSSRQMAALLLEGIIFRVARIVEEFNNDAVISKVYLAGGLSEVVALRQGLALCLPCPLFRLQQHDASLQGAALLAAGSVQGSAGQVEKIQCALDAAMLRAKYQRWKQWLDVLLAQ